MPHYNRSQIYIDIYKRCAGDSEFADRRNASVGLGESDDDAQVSTPYCR